MAKREGLTVCYGENVLVASSFEGLRCVCVWVCSIISCESLVCRWNMFVCVCVCVCVCRVWCGVYVRMSEC